jgi:hypothetical protein
MIFSKTPVMSSLVLGVGDGVGDDVVVGDVGDVGDVEALDEDRTNV